jgi:hypothetical protein
MRLPYETWPDWLMDAIIRAYQEGTDTRTISQTLLRPEGAIRSRLVRAGVYVSQRDRARMKRAEQSSFF